MTVELRDMLAPLRAIPDEVREFSFDAELARAHFGLDTTRLGELHRAGLPRRRVAGALRYDFGDLHFAGMRLGTARAHRLTARHWASGLNRLSAAPRTPVTVTYLPQLNGVAETVTGLVRLFGGDEQETPLRHNRPAAVERFDAEGEWPALPPDAGDAIAALADIELCLLQVNEDIARSAKLADCWTAARLLVEACAALGFSARTAHGLLISVPYSTMHGWAEVLIDGRWVPIDPCTLRFMQSFGGLDASRWPVDRSPGAFLARVSESFRSLVEVDGRDVKTTFLTVIGDAPTRRGPGAEER